MRAWNGKRMGHTRIKPDGCQLALRTPFVCPANRQILLVSANSTSLTDKSLDKKRLQDIHPTRYYRIIVHTET